MAAFSPEFLNRLSELGNEYQRLSEKHEQLQQQEQQLQQQKQKLQDEMQQLQEGRVLLVTENRSLIEKLQEVTDEKQQLHKDLEELKAVKNGISLQLAERDEKITQLLQQQHAQRAAHETEILKHNEKREQMQQENADLQEKLKNVNKKRQDLTDQIRLATEEHQRKLEEISSLAAEKQQLLDWKKQQIEESRLLAGRVRTLTLKQKQLQEEKQQAINTLKRQQEEQQLKWERRLRSLEQMRDETLAQLKSVEEAKTKEVEEHARETAEKQQWQSKAVALEDQLQQVTLELHRVEDALNTEKNIVEENRQRHELDMQEYVRRALEQQNGLKRAFAADYRRACDELERCSRERQHIIESVLEFARAHGCSYYFQQTGSSITGNSMRNSSTITTAAVSTSQKNALDSSSSSLEEGALASALACPFATAVTAAAVSNTDSTQIIPAEGSAAATEQQQQRQQQRGTMNTTDSENRTSTDGGSAVAATVSSSLSPCSPSAIPTTLRLIGARMAALEAAAEAANQQQKRSMEERDALQKALVELAEKARAATDAKQQLALRFSAVIYGIRELSEKAAFEQQLVKPLLDPFRPCSSSFVESTSTFTCPLLNTGSEVEGENISLSSVRKNRVINATAKGNFDNRVRTCAVATSDMQRADGSRVMQRADAVAHERCFAEDFIATKEKEIGGEVERDEEISLRASRHGHTPHKGHAIQNVTRKASHLAVHGTEEKERNGNEEELLRNIRLCRDSKTDTKPHEAVAFFAGKENAGGHAKSTAESSAFPLYNDVRYVQYNCDDTAELRASQNRGSYAVFSPQRSEKFPEKKPFHHFENNEFPSTPRMNLATGTMQSAVNNVFQENENSAEERKNTCNNVTAGALASVLTPSQQSRHMNYVCGSWDKQGSGDAKGREEEETTDSSGPSTCDHHSCSNENAFEPFDPCTNSPE